MERLLLSALALLAGGCTCERPEPRDAGTAFDEARIDVWPAAVIELGARPPATRITVRPADVEVDNRALVATWPEAARARARAAGGPTIEARAPIADEAALDDRLRTARGLERAASGAGSGAGLCDLRVASDVPFSAFERVLLAAGRAGYHTPRVLLGEDDALVAFEWPRVESAGGPSQREIVDALAAIERGEAPTLADPGASDARLRLDASGASLFVGPDRRCADLRLETVEACVRGLVAPRVTVEVAAALPFGEVAPWVQHASLATDQLGVRSVR